MFVSIHNNATKYNKLDVCGTETFYYPSNTNVNGLTGKQFADLIQNSLLKKLKSFDRKVRKSGGLVVLKYTIMPAILVEIGFMTNPAELEKLLSDDYQNLIVKGLSEAIEKAVNIIK